MLLSMSYGKALRVKQFYIAAMLILLTLKLLTVLIFNSIIFSSIALSVKRCPTFTLLIDLVVSLRRENTVLMRWTTVLTSRDAPLSPPWPVVAAPPCH